MALGLTIEHHLLARPSLATVEMQNKIENKIAQRTKRTQLQIKTSTASFCTCYVESFRNSNAQACFGRKQLSVQTSKEEKMLQQDEKYQRLRDAEAKDSETKFKTSLLQTNVKGQRRCG